MSNKIPLFSQTQEEFSSSIFKALGKGQQHAALVYEEMFRYGNVLGRDPAFKNAQKLLVDILQLTDLSTLSLSGEKHDGITGKFLLKTEDNLEIETVLIPMQSGGTLCVSSQIGCRMGCTFCETGRMGLLRNLQAHEIIAQVFFAKHILGFAFRNIVFMGMGEPFDNYDNVLQAIKVLNEPKGLAFGRKHITVSTSGCILGIKRLISEGSHAPNLAVSLNAPQDLIRNRLMPINRKHNMNDLYQAMNEYCMQTKRQILIAYVLIQGHNDSLEHANQLAEYLKGLNVKINLIPYNPQSCDRFKPPEEAIVQAFTKRLRDLGYYTLLRVTKGQKIMAACGQLGNIKLRKERARGSAILGT